MKTLKPSILVAYMPNLNDWVIANEKKWYRIPKEKGPKIIKENRTEYIAFYFPSIFGEEKKWKVTHYAKVNSIKQVSRKELFPNETINSKSEKLYYQVCFDNLEELSKPFISRRGHRIVFVSTTSKKFFSGETDFNILFQSSSLEKKMETIMDAMTLEYEREWREYVDRQKFYYLDFAVWCKKGAIDIECDGDAYHMENEKVHLDKTRNNELESYGWSVLRFTSKHFDEEKEHIESTIYKTIKELGGAIKVSEPSAVYYPKIDDKNGQMNLFDG